MLALLLAFAVISLHARTVLYPTTSQIAPGRTLHWDAEDVDDFKRIICRYPVRSHTVRHTVASDAEDLENRGFYGFGFVAEDAENKFHIGRILKHVAPLVLAEDEVENKKINWGEITKIAGQVNQIGQILGFDAEDIDDKKINWGEITKIAGQVNQIGQILGFDTEDFENGLGKKLKKLGRRIGRNIRREIPKVTEIAGKVAQVGEALGYDAEDAEDKVHWSVTVGNEDDVEDKINWGEITKIAGQVNQIGQILGFDAEDVDNFLRMSEQRLWEKCQKEREEKARKQKEEEEALYEKAKQEAAERFAKMNKGKRFDAEDLDDWSVSGSVSVSFDADEAEDRGINWGEITKIAGQVNQIGKVLGFDAEDTEDKFHIGKIIKHALPLVLADDVENKKINWGEITKIAGQVNQIGQILGFDSEDAENILPGGCTRLPPFRIPRKH